jgi:hypothetical protein
MLHLNVGFAILSKQNMLTEADAPTRENTSFTLGKTVTWHFKYVNSSSKEKQCYIFRNPPLRIQTRYIRADLGRGGRYMGHHEGERGVAPGVDISEIIRRFRGQCIPDLASVAIVNFLKPR